MNLSKHHQSLWRKRWILVNKSLRDTCHKKNEGVDEYRLRSLWWHSGRFRSLCLLPQGYLLLLDNLWIFLATNSLPEPVGPKINTLLSELDNFSICSLIFVIFGLLPINSNEWNSLVSNSLGYGFGLLAYFLLFFFILFIGSYFVGFISFLYVRYFGSVKKVKKRRLKKK